MSYARPIVAVIEADANARRQLCALLRTLDAEIQAYESAESYLADHHAASGCLITDMVLPGMSGIELLRLLRTASAAPPVILLGEESDVTAAVEAMREGAVDFIEKPRVEVSILKRVAYLLDHTPTEVMH